VESVLVVLPVSRIPVSLPQVAPACRQDVDLRAHAAAEGVCPGARDGLARTMKLVFTSTAQPVEALDRVRSASRRALVCRRTIGIRTE
jgi:hypothetical protein